MILVFLLKSGSVTLKTVPVIVDIITQYSRTEVPREVGANTDPALAEDASVARTTAPTFVCEAGAANGLACGGAEVVDGGSASIGEDDEADVPGSCHSP